MPPLTTNALVIRRADYSDYDRMVTLFTPDRGRIDAIARGCRRPKSPLVNAVEPFVSGEYQLFQRGERFSIEQCQLRESHFELRSDYDRLRHGVYWLKLIDAGVPREVPARDLFLTTLTALAHLNYTDHPAAMLTMAFEMHFMALSGYPPRVDACVRCGRPVDGHARFDARLGGTVCASCPSAAPEISNGARRILLKLPRTRYENAPKLVGHPDWPEAARLFRPYVQYRMQIAAKFLPPEGGEG